ncbi:MAG: hypothetical protein WC934_08390 [Acidithiobacillus sp.]|jgi:uncharacterized protein involved in cysteine biosynthesis|uniref:hypothetical protein n=1 Tax=Acidithiobacillus sp. TaxID=1872118 RepID=UPI00355F2B60
MLFNNPRSGKPDLMRTLSFYVTIVILIQYLLSWLPVLWGGICVVFDITNASWLLGIVYGGYSVRKATDSKIDNKSTVQ